MKKRFGFLLNKTVVKAEAIHDYLQLYFSDSSILNINNSYQINDDLSRLKNTAIKRITEERNSLRISFLNGEAILVDMSDGGYNCPESMTYFYKNKIITFD